MSGGRIESERLGLALDRVRERAPRPAADVKPSDSRPAQASPIAPEHLETFTKPADHRSANSPRQRIADFIAPKLSDPTVLQSAKLVPILERLVSHVLPNLEDSEEFRTLAGTLISDEIGRHRDLMTRLNGGIAA
jgi:hypothetical protein